jgi:peptidoglycan/LPS O-acetylase OafA/YrhL
MWVVLFHASEGGHIGELKARLPEQVAAIVFDAGHYGVAIFFALSGFVIAHSIRDAEVNGRYLGRFALRRSIRLDPPYWASIAVVVGLGALSAQVKGETMPLPSAGQLIAHLFYLQTILGYPQINWVYWTLTYEVQFYLMLVVGIWISQRAGISKLAILSVPLVLTASVWLGTEPHVRGLFVDLWHCFFAGVLAYWAREERPALMAFGALALAILLLDGSTFSLISLSTAAGLLMAGKTGYLSTGLDYRPLQFLGTISYSLYLLHNPITGAASFAAAKVTTSGLAILALILAAVIATAYAFWWLFERPAITFAHKVKLPKASQHF